MPEQVCEFHIPPEVRILGSQCLADQEKLEQVTIPDSVVSLEYGVFRNCPKLRSIELPASVTEIEGNPFAFSPCRAAADSEAFRSIDGVLFTEIPPGKPTPSGVG